MRSRGKTPPPPPRLARVLLERLGAPEFRDAMLGDFEEDFARIASRRGLVCAHAWYWYETLKSSLVLGRDCADRHFERSRVMNEVHSQRKPVVIGLIAMIPAIALFLGVFLQFGLGSTYVSDHLGVLIHPLPLMLGLVLAFFLNALTLVRIRYTEGAVVASLDIRGHASQLAVGIAALVMIKVILAYLVVENFRFMPR